MKRNCLISWWLGVALQILLLHSRTIKGDLPPHGVQLLEQDQHHVVMNNGIVSITLTVPGGAITNITYKGGDNLLQTKVKETDRGHWNIFLSKASRGGIIDNLEGTSYTVIAHNDDQIEISFTRTWIVGSTSVPLNLDKRFVMLRGSPGFYTYIVLEYLKGWPSFNISEGRIVFKLQEDKFYYMAISDERQRIMPKPEDRITGQVLDYKEAVLLTNPANPEFKGEVDDKYFYSCDDKDNKVHGWVSSDPAVGFWSMTPSDEFRSGGPIRQDLTSHVGPTILFKFISKHYAGPDLALKFDGKEYWKKVIGPVYTYLNSDPSASTNPSILWEDAKKRMEKEVASWPYSFPLSKDFVKANQRGAVSGQLLVYDWFVHKNAVPGASAYVGLAPPGAAGSWQFENKGYQFWTQTDLDGNFLIKNVIPGTYSLFAWVPGFLGDYKHAIDIIISPGFTIKATNAVFKVARHGATLWEIGIPDRSAAEFYIPDPDPKFKIHKYKNGNIEKFRQYGLWSRYKDLYPQKDLVFTIGQSDYKKDWFFAHVLRDAGNGQFLTTTWQVIFDLKHVNKGANYTLQLALASANNAELQVRVNNPKSHPHFTTGSVGMDNALARHAIRGLYHSYSVGIVGSHLLVGRNTIYLTQAKNQGRFAEVMYDYIRLEGPLE